MGWSDGMACIAAYFHGHLVQRRHCRQNSVLAFGGGCLPQFCAPDVASYQN